MKVWRLNATEGNPARLWAQYRLSSDAAHITKTYFLRTRFNIILHFCLGLSSGRCPRGFSAKMLLVFLASPVRSTISTSFIKLVWH